MLLVYLAVAWAAGIATASVVKLPPAVWGWWLLLPTGLLLIWWRDPSLRRLHVCLLLFLLGALRFTLALPQFDDRSLAFFNDRGALTLVGDVIDPPQAHDRVTNVRVAVTRVRMENEWRAVSGVALVQVPRETDVRYGDQVQVYGEPTTPPEFDVFSYRDYLARQGIHSLVRVYGGVKILARDQGNPFFAALYAFKGRALAALYAIFPDPAASLLAGILLGDDSSIPRDLNDAFSKTNTAHIIAISGFNVAIVAGLLAQLAQRVMGARRATVVVLLGLAAYTLLVGASPSVVRAAIMGSLTVIAVHYHRQNDALNALAAAALLMLLWNPLSLFDLGFQLSLLATLGLISYTVRLSNAFAQVVARFTSDERAGQIVGALNDSFVVTLAAQITALPLIIFTFHRLSLVGLLTNLVILPVQPAVMILGGIATLTGMLIQPIGQVIAWGAWAFLEFTIVVVQATASLPFAAIDVGRFDVLLLGAYYALLFGATHVDWRALYPHPAPSPGDGGGHREAVHPGAPFKTPLNALALGVALVVGMWMWNLALTAPDGKTHVEFLDGGTTLVRTPRGTRVVIDGGASPSVISSALGRWTPFWDRSLDLLVLTSADDDHLTGLVAVLERYDVRQVIEVSAPAKPTAAYVKWRGLVAEKRVPSAPAQDGVQVALDQDVVFEILHSAETGSAIGRLRTGSLTILFADSADSDDQRDLLASGTDPTGTVLIPPRKIAPEFFDAVNPQIAVLFVGRGARDKPSADLLAALSGTTVLRTDERGTIELIADGQTLAVRTQR